MARNEALTAGRRGEAARRSFARRREYITAILCVANAERTEIVSIAFSIVRAESFSKLFRVCIYCHILALKAIFP